ncbi:hypothetical protein [Sphingomonas asaccharolytica]|uniref:hypothetical protein n=1 Tax=Sphingomonas asaccharolytica TaxID=40681 RepID=UPI000833C0C4|nr:hypothetical protein [Sphingomonas asaccharolytica]
MKRFILGLATLSFAVPALPNASMAAARPGIEGSWQTGCLPIGKNGRHGFITRLEIKRGRITASSQIYAHNDCDTPTVHTEYRGKIIDVRWANDGVTDFDHEVAAITTTADDPEVVTIYNASNSGCGFGGGWQLGVARAVDGRTCAPWTFPAAGMRLYERGWIAGDELRIGSFPTVWTNTTPEKRPTSPGLLVFRRVTQ